MGRKGAGRIEDGDERKITEEDGRRKPGGNSKEFIPPDGGYGWVIVFASGMTSFCILPLIQNFGLVYKDSLKRWNITTAEYSVITNLQFSFLNGVGLISGPLLKAYGYRRVTFFGSVMVNVSAVLTSQVNKFYLFLITYSFLGGVGVGLVWIATSLAINTYFKKRRGVATGIAWAATGLSPVIFPHLLTWLRTQYDVHGTVLITSGIMMHSIPASLLLHPVEQHAEYKEIDGGKAETPAEGGAAEDVDESKNLVGSPGREKEDEEWSVGEVGLSGTGGSRHASFHQHSRKRHSLPHTAHGGAGDVFVGSQETLGLDIAAPMSLHSSRVSLENSGATNLRRTAGHSDFVGALAEAKDELEVEDSSHDALPEERKSNRMIVSGRFGLYLRMVAEYFDLYLLCDFRFLMIFIGLTLAYGGEINFSLLAPFVFLDYGFPLEEVATLISSLAFVDLVTRFTMPFISDHFKLNCLAMYSIGLVILGTGRIMLAHLSGYSTVLCVTLWLGLGKGFRTVYMALIMPSIVPLEKLGSASGLQTLANGIFFFAIGPLFGYIRDNSVNYTSALYAINFFTICALLVWMFEANYIRRDKMKDAGNKNKKKNITKYSNSLISLK